MKKLSPAGRMSVLALSIALSAPFAVQAQNIAIVNGKAVPKARVDSLLQQATRGGQQATPELEAQVRDEVVLREMFVQEAEKLGIARTADYKNQMELARQSVLIRELFNDYVKKHPVTDAEVQAEYDKHRAQAGDAEYHARHILVEKEDQAVALIKQLKAGAKFDELAKANSTDKGSGANGGDLDWANANNYVPEFAQALKSLKKGQITETPVKSQYGYHVILLEDTREVQFPAFESVKQQIQQSLSQQKLAQFREEIKKKAKTDYTFSH